MWHDMLDVGIPYAEKTIRTVAVYLALLVLLRIVGKRGLAQLNEFDLVVMLLLSNVVQNAIIGPDNSLIGGLYGAAVLLLVNTAVVRYGVRFDRVVRWLEGTPTVLVRHGQYDAKVLRRQGLRRADLALAIREQGGDGIAETETVVMAPNGALLVKLKEADQNADKADMEKILDAIARLEARLDGAGRL